MFKNFIQNSFQSQKVFYRYFRRKGWKRFLKENILQTDGSNTTKALSVALGVFVGLTPLFGFHTVIVLFLATAFKLNKLISYMCTHVSFPPFVPFIIMASLWIGDPFVAGDSNYSDMIFTKETIKTNLLQYLIGSSILAVASSILLGTLTFLFLEKIKPSKSH